MPTLSGFLLTSTLQKCPHKIFLSGLFSCSSLSLGNNAIKLTFMSDQFQVIHMLTTALQFAPPPHTHYFFSFEIFPYVVLLIIFRYWKVTVVSKRTVTTPGTQQTPPKGYIYKKADSEEVSKLIGNFKKLLITMKFLTFWLKYVASLKSLCSLPEDWKIANITPVF